MLRCFTGKHLYRLQTDFVLWYDWQATLLFEHFDVVDVIMSDVVTVKNTRTVIWNFFYNLISWD